MVGNWMTIGSHLNASWDWLVWTEWFNGWGITFLSPPLIYMFTLDIGQLESMQCRWDSQNLGLGGGLLVCVCVVTSGLFSATSSSSSIIPHIGQTAAPQTAFLVVASVQG